MPLIQVKVIEGVFSQEQKQEVVKKLTDAMVSIEGENMRPVTWCIVEEVKSGHWGIAGNTLTTEDVKDTSSPFDSVTTECTICHGSIGLITFGC